MKLEENSPLWNEKIDTLKTLLTILPNLCLNHKSMLLQLFISYHGPIPDRFGKEVKGLFCE